MTNNDDLQIRVATVEASTKSAHKRIDELQVITKAFYELAADVKVMVSEMANMKKDINDIKTKVDAEENEPNKLLFNIKNAVLTGLVGAMVGAIVALIMK